MLDEHPIVRWVSVVSLVVGVAGGAWFVMDTRERAIKQSERLAEIRGEQEGIRRELATQTVSLDEIRDEQDQIAARQRWLSSEVNRSVATMATDLGRLMERTDGK